MSVADWTLCFAIFNSLAVPLLLHGYRWTKKVERRLERLERELRLHPLDTN